jgi:hypothetical protein
MDRHPAKPFYLDRLTRKHEAYPYGERDAQLVEVEHRGRTFRLLMPRYSPPVAYRVSAAEGDFLFLIGEQLDHQDEDGRLIEGGDVLLIVARRMEDRGDTYWTLACHNLFSYTMGYLDGPRV